MDLTTVIRKNSLDQLPASLTPIDEVAHKGNVHFQGNII